MRNKHIYKIRYSHSDRGCVDVKASSEKEALAKCSKMYDNGRLRKFDINEQWDAAVVSVEDNVDYAKENLAHEIVQNLNNLSLSILTGNPVKKR